VSTPSTNCSMSPPLAPDNVGRVLGFKREDRPRIAKVRSKGS
jgi:hypothetical protein